MFPISRKQIWPVNVASLVRLRRPSNVAKSKLGHGGAVKPCEKTMTNSDSQKPSPRRGDPVSKRSFSELLATISWLAAVFVGANNVKQVTGRGFIPGPPAKQGGAERLASVAVEDYATAKKLSTHHPGENLFCCGRRCAIRFDMVAYI